MDITLTSALWGLATSAFVSSTLFPGGSEAVFLWVIDEYDAFYSALTVATLANTAGSMTGYCIGRFLPKKVESRAIDQCEKYGAWVLLLAWLPIVGDALPVAAGWLRIHWVKSLLFILVGKAFRYAAIGYGFSQIF